MVITCTTSLTFTNSMFCPHTLYLCVLYGSENQQWLFPYTALNNWFRITETECVNWFFNYNSGCLFVGLLPRRLGFHSSPVHLRFLVDKLAVWQVSLLILGHFPVSIIPPVSYTHLHLQHALNRRLHSLETFRKALSEIGEHRIGK